MRSIYIDQHLIPSCLGRNADDKPEIIIRQFDIPTEQPIINGKYLQETLGMSPMASSRALKILAERGVLKESSGGRRSTVWEHRGVLSVLDDYAARLRRE